MLLFRLYHLYRGRKQQPESWEIHAHIVTMTHAVVKSNIYAYWSLRLMIGHSAGEYYVFFGLYSKRMFMLQFKMKNIQTWKLTMAIILVQANKDSMDRTRKCYKFVERKYNPYKHRWACGKFLCLIPFTCTQHIYTICRLNDDLFLCPFIIRKFEHKRSFCFSSLYSGGPYNRQRHSAVCLI